MEIKIIRPFGPSILKVEIPKNIINELNKYIDLIVLDNEKKVNLNYGEKLAGDVTQEFKLEKEMVSKIGWLDFLGKCVYEWIKKDFGKNITKFNLIESWVVRQFKNEYNPVHWHSGHISGAGFLKVPTNLGGFTQKVTELRIDDDQDSVWMTVDIGDGASCHVGYRSCFYRSIPMGPIDNGRKIEMEFLEKEKKFDPEEVYKGQPNPTKI